MLQKEFSSIVQYKFFRNKITKLIVALLVGAVIIFLISLTFKPTITNSKKDPDNTATKQRFVVTQAYLSGMTSKVTKRDNEIYYYLIPRLNLQVVDDIDTQINKFEVINITLSNYPKGAKYKVVKPHHVNTLENNVDPYFNTSMQADDFDFEKVVSVTDKIEYEVVDGASTPYRDDFARKGDSIEFLVIVYQIGNYDEESIIKSDGKIDSSKYLQYAKIEQESITGEISFIVLVTFENGEQTFKKFNFAIEGEEMVNKSYLNFDPKIDGSKF
ncbi:MAG: hypothetical protein WCJ58_07390 [bacterium]